MLLLIVCAASTGGFVFHTGMNCAATIRTAAASIARLAQFAIVSSDFGQNGATTSGGHASPSRKPEDDQLVVPRDDDAAFGDDRRLEAAHRRHLPGAGAVEYLSSGLAIEAPETVVR